MLPLLNTEGRAENSDHVPTGDHLRFAIATIMRTAARPTGCVSLGGLTKYITRMQKDIDSREPTITWPVAAQPGREIGRNYIKIFIITSFRSDENIGPVRLHLQTLGFITTFLFQELRTASE